MSPCTGATCTIGPPRLPNEATKRRGRLTRPVAQRTVQTRETCVAASTTPASTKGHLMAVTVNVNNLSLVHKGSLGVSTATVPDVCKTPPNSIPAPYPNIAFSRDLTKGTKKVKADGGKMCAIAGSQFSKSTGDEPGRLGGVTSGTVGKEATWITYSFDVKF